jgi:hypothetical protein
VSLCLGVDGDRPHSGDRPALIQEIGADDPSLGLGDDAPDRGVRDEVARELPGCFERGEVTREPVVVMQAPEGLVQDSGTLVAVGGLDRANCDRHAAFRHDRFGCVGHGSSTSV